MTKSLDPFRFLLMAVSGWMSQQQMQLTNYLQEEHRVLREQLGQRRLRFNDDQRRRSHLSYVVLLRARSRAEQ